MIDPMEFIERVRYKFPFLEHIQVLPLSIREGWYPIVEKFLAKLNEFYLDDPNKHQWKETFEIKTIKEKFGTLRIYYAAPITVDQQRTLSTIINESARICEVCGQSGELRTDSMGMQMRTRCGTHYRLEC